jgi:hypothetical protein
MLEVQYANAITNFPLPMDFGTDLCDGTCGFVRWNHGKICCELTLQYLKIRVAETCSVDLDQKVMFTTFWNATLA